MTALPAQPRLALRGISGNLTRTERQTTAWYRLATHPWSFRGDAEREQLIQLIACQLGALAGRHLRLRVTSRPYEVRRWAEVTHGNAIDRPPTPAGALSWPRFLQGEQQHLAASDPAEKEVFLGVDLATPSRLRRKRSGVEWSLAELTDLLGGPGLAATPARPGELLWLVMRSLGLGLPGMTVPELPPGTQIGEPELLALTGQVALCAEPGDPTVTVLGQGSDGSVRRRHLAVLTVGQMQPLRIPEVDDPWMQRTDRLPFPVEWSARFTVRRPEDVSGELRRQMGKVRSQMRHYVLDHGEEPPTSLQRAAEQVLAIEDQLSAGLTQMHTRASGWWRIAVTGADEAETTSRVQQVLDLYRPKIAIEQPRGQFRLAREFVPGEPVATSGHRRRGSVTWVAAAMPAAAASIGDDGGVLLGQTCTATRRPVAWDPWLAQEQHQRSGLTAIVGGLGSGKSNLVGTVVHKTLLAGARWTVLDPSGPLARLTELPEIAPFARHVNLMRAAPGVLNPYRVVAEPHLAHFTDTASATAEQQWRDERRAAAATRRQLVVQVLTGLLPHDVARMPETRIRLQRAVKQVGGAPDRHPGLVVDTLRQHAVDGDEHAGIVADFLDERRDLPQAALLFPTGDGATDPWTGDADIRLTVLTMQGLTLPRPGSPREEWSDTEALGVELLNLASWLTQRTIYDADPNARKGVALDETHFLSQVPTGKVLIDRLARDSRKFNVRALFASQLAGDLLRVSGFASLVDAVFVGRTDDAEAQADALRLLRVPTGVGYEPLLATLSAQHGPDHPRQFVFADGRGGVEAIRIDLSAPHLAHLRAALDTNPSAAVADSGRFRTPSELRRRPMGVLPAAEPEVVHDLPTWPGQRTPQLSWDVS
ncbi:ATP-binding protein [Pseudonocardia sp. CA-107938]|uniref:ATP-binding protein n=1 Tax=Pseudonocardia sp. CA-107938 TaxID=3240021 RepID=UPI003D8B42BE